MITGPIYCLLRWQVYFLLIYSAVAFKEILYLLLYMQYAKRKKERSQRDVRREKGRCGHKLTDIVPLQLQAEQLFVETESWELIWPTRSMLLKSLTHWLPVLWSGSGKQDLYILWTWWDSVHAPYYSHRKTPSGGWTISFSCGDRNHSDPHPCHTSYHKRGKRRTTFVLLRNLSRIQVFDSNGLQRGKVM